MTEYQARGRRSGPCGPRAPGRSTRVHLATLYCSVLFHSITRSSTCSSQNNVGQGQGSRESTTPWYSGRSTGCDSNEYDCTGHAHVIGVLSA